MMIFVKARGWLKIFCTGTKNIREPEDKTIKRPTEVPKISSDDSCRKRNLPKAQRISINEL
jgi:hypothetical protein